MLLNIHPLLVPDLLFALAQMGHGDEIVIADANFPATTVARRLIRVDGAGTLAVLEAIGTVFPLDTFVESPAVCMKSVATPDEWPAMATALKATVNKHFTGEFKVTLLERAAFYERARGAFAVVATGEQRSYGNIILTKGVTSGAKPE